ncbi:MAG TPA: glycosyltransferase family 4 protein [Gemmataceae bacterium]|nr:glycosyltransferase family 4 protein [Gemmataceae bacterium]
MNTKALSRNEGSAPSPSGNTSNGQDARGADNVRPLANGVVTSDNGHAQENEQVLETKRATENGHAGQNGYVTQNGHAKLNGTKVKRDKRRKTRHLPSSRPTPPASKQADAPRPALAIFCWEPPDTSIGQSVLQTAAALARRQTTVHLFSRFPIPLTVSGLHHHAVGDVEGDDFFARVQEFTSRAANAFLHQFPGGSPHVTLMGYEWSGAGPLGLLRGLKNNRAVFSISSLERQRSDMTSEISKRIDELESTTLRESQVILTQEPAAAEVARFWVPECAARLTAARQPFPVASFNNKIDPGEVKARYQVGPIDPVILYVGDFSDRYGPDVLVKAMPAILRNHPQARLILVGDGSLYWTMRVYSRYLLLDHAIRFPGSVVGQDMHELVQAADVIAVPSRDATPWWPIQAAWAAQRPVVATHHAAPALLEHERDSVLVYPVEQSMVWGVERLLYDPEFSAALAQKGHEKLEERFGWNNVAEQIEELMGVPARK